MKTFKPGDRVLWTEKGLVGSVYMQFNGDVLVDLDQGWVAHVSPLSLQIQCDSPAETSFIERLRLSIVDRQLTDQQVRSQFIDSHLGQDDLEELLDFMSIHRPQLVRASALQLFSFLAQPHPLV